MKPKEPPIDWLKAAILERMAVFGFTREDVCSLAKISATTFRAMMNEPPTATALVRANLPEYCEEKGETK